ncbi:MAG: hypothetical protein JSV04_14470 [Candidatus Heimdallarchaeota archaeon]|nr:MAG: hypothetical protein JSV04_14470 [Candidatus Heimdallarchaeota archaeon]
MISPLRGKLFDIFAKYYEEYGIPGLCGWIDTLFLLEPKILKDHPWTQRSISKRLTELFPNGKYPTSVSSINRAIKINVKYGTVLKEGTHKTGYTYTPTTGTEMITKIFEGFIDKTNVCIDNLQDLLTQSQDSDSHLTSILKDQIDGYNAYVQLLEYTLNFFEKEHSSGGS